MSVMAKQSLRTETGLAQLVLYAPNKAQLSKTQQPNQVQGRMRLTQTHRLHNWIVRPIIGRHQFNLQICVSET